MSLQRHVANLLIDVRDGAVKMATAPSLDRFQAQPKQDMSGQVFELARVLKSVPELARQGESS